MKRLILTIAATIACWAAPRLTRYLVRRSDGSVFIWTLTLSKRTDLEEVFAESPALALNANAMPDPKHLKLADLEAMTKEDLLLFAELKLKDPEGKPLKLNPKLQRSALVRDIKVAIFDLPADTDLDAPAEEVIDMRPEELKKKEAAAKGAAKTTTRPMSSAAQARQQAGM